MSSDYIFNFIICGKMLRLQVLKKYFQGLVVVLKLYSKIRDAQKVGMKIIVRFAQ